MQGYLTGILTMMILPTISLIVLWVKKVNDFMKDYEKDKRNVSNSK
jgi:hypothetical protein